ncbi:MAG TPA: hypothetical protein VKZ72_06030 [Acidimicrobiales bacterium]|jgi:hypothetical protein|nr:hypothetical protein [Acidimicrobiales bacterium]
MAATRRTRTPPARQARGRAVVAVAALALLAGACGDDDGDTEASGGGGGDGLDITITSPADGEAVEAPFEVEVDTGVDIGEPDTGLHHVHLYYDGGDSDYDMAFEPTFTVERDLEPGEHTIEAVIANADHSLTDARDEVTVTIGAGGSGGGTDATDGDDPGGDGY